MQVLMHRVHIAPLTLVAFAGALASGACSGERPSAAACIPGDLYCVCDHDHACKPGLSCVATRCVKRPGGSAGTEEESSPDASASSPEQDGEGSPLPDDSQGAEPTAGGQPTDEPSDSSSSEDNDSQPEGDETSEDEPGFGEQEACKDGVRNYRETDVDCGGPICERCDLGQQCRGGVDCKSEVCADGVCALCEEHSQCDDANDCTADRCQDNACTHIAKAKGAVCDDGDPCTAKDRCQASGACEGESTLVLDEHFDNNKMRWKVMYANQQNDARSLWKLGSARASDCGGLTGEDPAQDHTQNGKNGVAGMVLGGCNARAGSLKAWDCFWSKDFEVYRFDEPVVVSFWRHLHSPASGSRGVVHRIVWRDVDAPNDVRDFERGYGDAINDSGWEPVFFQVPKKVRRAIGVGICYQKKPGAPTFAGWTIDDFKIRQRGCMLGG